MANRAIRALARGLRRGLWFVLLLAVLGGGAGAVLGYRLAANHSATVSVFVVPLEGNPYYPGGRGDDINNVLTEAELARSDAVAQAVIARLGLDMTPAQLLGHVSASVPPNTQIVEITFDNASSPDQAQQIDEAFGNAYLALRSDRTQSLLDVRAQQLQSQIDEETSKLGKLNRRLDRTPPGGTRAFIQDQINTATSQISLLNSQLTETRSSSVVPGEVVTPAHSETRSLTSTALLLGGVGVVLGAFSAVLLLIARRRAGDRVYDPADASIVGINVLGVVGSDQAMDLAGEGEVGPDYQAIRVALIERVGRRGAVLYGVLGEGADQPHAIYGIARSLAAARIKVTLMDASGEPGGVSDHLGHASSPGLVDALDGADVAPLLVKLTPEVSLLPAGASEGVDEDLLLTSRFREVVTYLKRRAGILLIVTGPLDQPRSRAIRREAPFAVAEGVLGQIRLRDLEGIKVPRDSRGRGRGTAPLRDEPGLVLVGAPGRHRTGS